MPDKELVPVEKKKSVNEEVRIIVWCYGYLKYMLRGSGSGGTAGGSGGLFH